MKYIDRLLNAITMYRLIVYGLGLVAVAGVFLSITGRLAFDPLAMVGSLALLLSSHYLTDRTLSHIWRVPRNAESWLITGLILFLIMPPPSDLADMVLLIVTGIAASAAKFLLTWKGKHIFNPAAFAAALLTLAGLYSASWWVGTSALWILTLIVGLAVVRKIRRFPLVITFIGTSLLLQFIIFAVGGKPIVEGMINAFTATPLIFLATTMLTEPATMPPRRSQQLLFGAGVAVLYTTSFSLGWFVVYPEVALLIGNVYAFIVSPRTSAILRLVDIQKISDRVYHYTFQPDRPLKYLPGQYMEWTLPGVPFDNRGNRRTFTIASSPTESTIQVGLKFYEPSSTYKYTFSRLQPGDTIHANQLAGSFTLKSHQNEKLAFIAGGIGVTPFRSMVKSIIDSGKHADIIMLYAASQADELAYMDVFREAARYGVNCIPIVTAPGDTTAWAMHTSINEQLIRTAIPDFAERRFYVSGPNTMVDTSKKLLQTLGVKRHMIATDHFSGY